VNLLGPFLLTRALLGSMLAAGRGSVINVSGDSSDAGVVGYPGWGAYGVSKAALDQMTRIRGRRGGRGGTLHPTSHPAGAKLRHEAAIHRS